MRKSIYIVLSLLAPVLAAKAQDTLKTGMWGRTVAGAAQVQFTYRPSSLGQLNTALGKNGLAPLGDNSLWLNLSMSHIHRKVVTEDGLGFTFPTNTETSAIKASYNQYHAYFRGGYDISKNDDFRLFPFVGIDFTGAVLNIKDKVREQTLNDFSQQISNLTASKTLFQPNFGIELGAGFDYLIKLKTKQMDCIQIQRSIPIGLRAGYYINTYAGDWKFDDYTLSGGPGNKQSAVFVSLNIGLGYVIKK